MSSCCDTATSSVSAATAGRRSSLIRQMALQPTSSSSLSTDSDPVSFFYYLIKFLIRFTYYYLC